jgi:uncharacterized protein YajQ (UPF0234 family)
MPSFDVVSKIDMQELDNAINQSRKEIGSRYDFQGTHTELALADDKQSILIKASNEGRIEAAVEVLYAKMAKRGISLRAIERTKIEPAAGSHVKQTVLLHQGISTEKAKELVKAVKDSKLKVQASIQGDALRVSGKSKDDLQSAIALLRSKQDAFEVDLQFNNFRD